MLQVFTECHLETLHKTEITGEENIDSVQHGVTETVGSTLGEKGIAGGVGNVADKGLLRGNV
jgi:hypothetical protein